MKINTVILKAVARTARQKITDALEIKKASQIADFEKTKDYKRLLDLYNEMMDSKKQFKDFVEKLNQNSSINVSYYNSLRVSMCSNRIVPSVETIYDELLMSTITETDIEKVINVIVEKYSN